MLDRQRLAWRSDSCQKCRGPSGEDLSKGYYEAGGSFLKLGIPEAFVVRPRVACLARFWLCLFYGWKPQQACIRKQTPSRKVCFPPLGCTHGPAGDHLEIPNLTHCLQVTILADSVINFPQGFRKAGDLDNGDDLICRCCRMQAFMFAMHHCKSPAA